MGAMSIASSSDTDYLHALIAGLSAICWQHEHTSDPNGQLVHEYRGDGHGEPRYRVTDSDTDPGRDWWPVAVVTTTGTIHAPGRHEDERSTAPTSAPPPEGSASAAPPSGPTDSVFEARVSQMGCAERTASSPIDPALVDRTELPAEERDDMIADFMTALKRAEGGAE